MKILRLRFKNIHSLKGEHLIDFTQKPLVDAGLFAITGATGAGKSTILDVITLALFNKIPRFSTKGTESVSKNEIEKSGSIITHFTNEAYAEIEYVCHDIAYRSKWSISTARTGNLRDYEMELATINDQKILPLKKSEVPSENERILGLNYEQFIRSILLSQGDFARFLKSDDKDRAKLLENITGSQIYRAIGAKAFARNKSIEDELKILRLRASEILLISDEELQEKQGELKANEHLVVTIKQQAATLAEMVIKVDRKLILQKSIDDVSTQILLLKDKIKEFEPDRNRLAKHRNLDVVRNALTLWKDAKLRLENLKISHLATTQEVVQKQKELTNALKMMSEFTKTEVNAENFMTQMKAFEIKIIGLDNELKNLETKGKDSKARFQAIIDKNPYPRLIALQTEHSTEVKYQKVRDILVELKQKTSKYLESDFELEELLKSIQTSILQKTSLLSDLQAMEALIAENLEIDKYLMQIDAESIQCQQVYSGWNTRLEQAKKELELANEKKLNWLRMASLEEHRANLVEHEPCPLCGAKEHPYVHHLPVQIGNAEFEVFNLTSEINDLEKNCNRNLQRISTLSGEMKAKKERQNGIKVAIDKLVGLHPENHLSATQVKDELGESNIEIQNIENELASRKEHFTFGEAMAVLEELRGLSLEYKQLKESRMSQYHGQDINGDADKIQNIFVASKEALQNLHNKITHIDSEIASLNIEWENLSNTLQNQLQELGYQHPESAFLDILSDSDLQKMQLMQDTLTKSATELDTKKVNILAELQDLESVDAAPSYKESMQTELAQLNIKRDDALTRIGILQGEINRYLEQEKYLAQLKRELAEKEKKAKPFLHLNALIGDGLGHKFAKFAQNLSLQHLISLANVRLAKLSDRYSLAATDIEEDLKIIDRYQGDTVRSVKTLSGGETFIVSLALALSLADMASQNVRLECLFIDEGFGTLDVDTMETALLTLEKLQADSNRMIGIISHVESLKERITTQIKVHKNNRGHSTIEVVDGNLVWNLN